MQENIKYHIPNNISTLEWIKSPKVKIPIAGYVAVRTLIHC